jgi:PTH2 family peptidyl-tRNA hydrolase
MATKQVIVMRTDLNMRKGKMIAQGSHASMAFLTRQSKFDYIEKDDDEVAFINTEMDNKEEAEEWMREAFTKICLQCNSEQELDDIYNKAKDAGLTVHLVIDKGLTEFNGVPTKTCLCIGPHYSEKIDTITKHLKLL